MKHVKAAALALLLVPSAAAAATSGWVETPGGSVRLIALPADAAGKADALLDIRLNEGWKTYWRDPGGSGIPPSIAISGAALAAVGFPAPRRLGSDNGHYIGYNAPVQLPLTLEKAAGGPVTATVFLGMCKDICIPVQAELTADTSGEAFASPLEQAALADAEARLPQAASKGFRPLSGHFAADGKSIAVRFEAPADGPVPEVFVSGDSALEFGASAPVRREGDAFVAEVPVLHMPKAFDAGKAAVRLTVRAGTRTMEAPLPLD